MSSSSSSSASSAAAAAFRPAVVQREQQVVEEKFPAAAAAMREMVLPPVAAAAADSEQEQLCYVHCHYCDTVLVVSDLRSNHAHFLSICIHLALDSRAFLVHPWRRVLQVSVPSSSLFKTVTVRCGHCSSLLTVNMRGLLLPTTAAAAPPPPPPPPPPAAHFPHSLNLAPANPPHHHSLLVLPS
jgi:hypothetical protein